MAFTSDHLFFDDVEVGQTWISQGRTITETDLVNFAGVSGDFNAIHMDQAFAEKTPFGRRIAHGLLVLSVSSGLVVNSPAMRTMAFTSIQSWNFLQPVYIGDTISVQSEVIEKLERARGRRGDICWRREVLNQDGVVVQEGTSITLIEGRASIRKRTQATS